MKTLRMTILSLSALIIFLSSTQAYAGTSDVRIRAKVRTPYVKVDVRTGDRRGNDHRVGRVSYGHGLRVSKHDKQMAGRLASYMDISRHELLVMLDRGYRWSEIRRHYGLSRKAVRAARSARSWRVFMRPVRHCGNYGH